MSGLDRLVLTSPQRAILAGLLSQFDVEVDAIVAYGSRATGQARPGSDLDLAVIGANGRDTASALQLALDESDLPFFSDVLTFDSHLDFGMRASILRDGIALAGKRAAEWRSLTP